MGLGGSVGGGGSTADLGVPSDLSEFGTCLSRDWFLEIGGLVGRLARRGSREDIEFGLSRSILSDMVGDYCAAGWVKRRDVHIIYQLFLVQARVITDETVTNQQQQSKTSAHEVNSVNEGRIWQEI